MVALEDDEDEDDDAEGGEEELLDSSDLTSTSDEDSDDTSSAPVEKHTRVGAQYQAVIPKQLPKPPAPPQQQPVLRWDPRRLSAQQLNQFDAGMRRLAALRAGLPVVAWHADLQMFVDAVITHVGGSLPAANEGGASAAAQGPAPQLRTGALAGGAECVRVTYDFDRIRARCQNLTVIQFVKKLAINTAARTVPAAWVHPRNMYEAQALSALVRANYDPGAALGVLEAELGARDGAEWSPREERVFAVAVHADCPRSRCVALRLLARAQRAAACALTLAAAGGVGAGCLAP